MTGPAIKEIRVPAGVPAEHRCGRCGELAPYVDRSGSGAILYTCTKCGDGKGHPTFVAVKEPQIGKALAYGDSSGQSAALAGGSGSVEGEQAPAQVVGVSPIACRGSLAGSDDCAVEVASRQTSRSDDSSRAAKENR